MSAMLVFSWSFQPGGLVDVADGHMFFSSWSEVCAVWGGWKTHRKTDVKALLYIGSLRIGGKPHQTNSSRGFGVPTIRKFLRFFVPVGWPILNTRGLDPSIYRMNKPIMPDKWVTRVITPFLTGRGLPCTVEWFRDPRKNTPREHVFFTTLAPT